jgi:hypothetical protein
MGAYLLEDGHLLRPGAPKRQATDDDLVGGERVQEFTWEGELVWDFSLSGDRGIPHHDVCKLPNGNVLVIAWKKKTAQEAIAAGRKPQSVRDSYLLADAVLEVKPTGKTTGDIVWEWHVLDHLIQDFDKKKANYGNVAEHPELIDINYDENSLAPVLATQEGVDKLKAIGYVGGNTRAGKREANPDLTHFNRIVYDPTLDQIMVCVRSFSEFWIIDHSTTTVESAGHKGGRGGKGGDLLYRWGNPAAYRAGAVADRRLFAAHDAHWIPKDLPGAGHILVFNNGANRPGAPYSSVEEIALPSTAGGGYARRPGACFAPDKALWSYASPVKADFSSMLLSGAQRLPNGNTLICSGMTGQIIEITPTEEVVWSYTTRFQEGRERDGFGDVGPLRARGPNMMRPAPGASGAPSPPSRFPLFRAHRYAPSYPGLAEKELKAGATIAEMEAKATKPE